MVGVAHSLVYDCQLSDAMTPDVLAQVTVPTLVLDSEGSSDDLTGSAAMAARLIPGARHKSLPGEWHVVAPELIAREIKAFLGSVARRHRGLAVLGGPGSNHMNLLATTLTLSVGDPAASSGFFTTHFGFREVLAFDGGAAVEHPGGGPTLFFLRAGLTTLEPSQRDVPARG
jgi:hypothetical protein